MKRTSMLKQTGLLGLALSAALAAGSVRPARGDVKLPAIFGSHMVLQQKQNDKVWGWAEPGEEVTVKIADQTKTAKADDDGAWSVTLDPLTAGGPHTMTVAGKNTVTFEDVLVGEVWVCSGQSNMQMTVNSSNDGDLESLAAHLPEDPPDHACRNVGTQEPQKDFNGQWSVCTPETVRDFSAVGYFFGRQLHETLDVPVGLINDSWGGSAAEAWVRRDLLEKDETLQAADRRSGTETREEGGPTKKRQLQRQLAGPGNIYNGVLKPTIGYGIKGAIWYQGESNAGRAYQYRDLFPLMIKSWRDEWGIGDFPFYWVQLADSTPRAASPAESAWAELREAQTMTMSTLPNTGQAVIIDLGEGKDIHPRNKQDVAKRLARWALAKDYGVKVPYQSPTYKSMETKDGKVVVTFDHVGGGLARSTSTRSRGSPSPATTRSSSGPRRRSSATTRSRSGPTRSPTPSPSATPGPTTPSATSTARTASPSPRSAPTTGPARRPTPRNDCGLTTDDRCTDAIGHQSSSLPVDPRRRLRCDFHVPADVAPARLLAPVALVRSAGSRPCERRDADERVREPVQRQGPHRLEARRARPSTARPSRPTTASPPRTAPSPARGGEADRGRRHGPRFPGDFVLRLEFRASPKANSGLFLRGKQLQVRDYPTVGPYKTLKHFQRRRLERDRGHGQGRRRPLHLQRRGARRGPRRQGQGRDRPPGGDEPARIPEDPHPEHR